MKKMPSLRNTYVQSFSQMTEVTDRMILAASSGEIRKTIDFDDIEASAALPDSMNSESVFGEPDDLRYGHITLPFPIVNIHYLRGKMPFLPVKLGMDMRTVSKITYGALYVVTASDNSQWPIGMAVDDKQRKDVPDGVTVMTQASAIEELLKLQGEPIDYIVLHHIPVLPGGLRYTKEEDDLSVSGLDLLTSRVLLRSNRIKRLCDIGGAPDIIMLNEKRMLQEMCDALIYNGCHGIPHSDQYGRPYPCLYDLYKSITGKETLDFAFAYEAVKKVDKDALAECLKQYDALADDGANDMNPEDEALLEKIHTDMDTIFHDTVEAMVAHYYPGYADHMKSFVFYAGNAYKKLNRNCEEMTNDETLKFIAEGILMQMDIFVKRCSMWA